MLPFLYLIIDVVIVLAYIAGPWIILAKLDFAWPDWLKDGIIVVILFVLWAGFALTQFFGWVLSSPVRLNTLRGAPASPLWIQPLPVA